MPDVQREAWLVTVDDLSPDNAVPPACIIVFDKSHAEAIATDVAKIVGRSTVYRVTIEEREQFNANR